MTNKLSKPTIAFHWLTGLLFIGVFVLGKIFDSMARSPEKFELLGIHKSLGFIVLVVASVRLAWRLKEGAISPASQLPRAQEILAKSIHHLLLLGTLLMPTSGIMMSIGGGRGVDVFGFVLYNAGDKVEWLGSLGSSLHGLGSNVLLVAVVLHVAGALKHQLVDKDGTLTRMLGR